MNKKQNYFSNLFLIFSIFFWGLNLSTLGQGIDEALSTADSLFKEKKYTESFEIYEKILIEDQQATPQMLMKMAFIKEGLGDHSMALLYLNKYYIKTSDKKARTKMESIADENTLYGYSNSDSDFFLGLINKYYYEFNGIVLFIALFLLGVILYRKFSKQINALPYSLSLIAVLILFFFLTNFQLTSQQGIIIENHAYLMSGPSSGSDLIDVVQKGHRLSILDENEIWIKVDWNGKEAYIRRGKIRPIG